MADLVSMEELGRLINPEKPLSPVAVRKRCQRLGIRSVRGYPRDEIRVLLPVNKEDYDAQEQITTRSIRTEVES